MRAYITPIMEAWEKGKEKASPSLLTDGEDVYSYGRHFPLVVRQPDGTILFNTDKYSATTTRQQNDVGYWLQQHGWRINGANISGPRGWTYSRLRHIG